MAEPLDALMARLRAEYLAEIPGRLDQLSRALAGSLPEEHGVLITLPRLFHRLAGSAGAYGYGEVTRLCREAERRLKADPPDESGVSGIIAEIGEAFRREPTEPSIES